MPAILLRWMIWGIGEVLLTLFLATIAPGLINSSWVWLGFLLWLGIILWWIGSVVYIINVVSEALAVRRLILRHFPQYYDRSWCQKKIASSSPIYPNLVPTPTLTATPTLMP